MKRLIALLFVFMLWSGISVAESTTDRPFTADEQAYDVYLDLSTAYRAGIDYLKEVQYLWKLATSLDSTNQADQIWFNAKVIVGEESDYLKRVICFQNLAQIKYGFDDAKGLYNVFSKKLGNTTNPMSIASPAINLAIEAKFILSPETIKEYMNEAKAGIRDIMKLDSTYAFTSQLQNYYKDLNLLLNYMSDLGENYFDFSDKVEEYAEKQITYDVDFEFIFDPSDYAYVREVRNTEKQSEYERIYIQAKAAENRNEYENAVELYWQCIDYSDASERIELCRNDTQENDYQRAIALQDTGNYKEAISIYKTLGNYKSSKSKMAQCEETLLPCEDIGSFSEGLAAIKKDGKYGYVSEYGSIIIPRSFDSASLFKSGFALVKKNGKWGYINKGGQIVIPCEYNSAYNFENGLAIVEKNGKYGFVNTTGKLVVPCEYEDAWDYKDGFARVKKNGKWGFVNTNGDLAFPCEYKTAQSFSEGYAPVSTNSIVVKGFINTQGKYTEVKGCEIKGSFSEGLILVQNSDLKYGFADVSGKVVIPCQFEGVGSFSDGLAIARSGSKLGFINKQGNWAMSLS